ncbi:MAG: protein kinase [Gammaproteobacteria bacterium]|nr:protein kinase [Gammaproteobacteria bacterium]MDH4254447.1 protein kinase [Gammaproteobacteria bacterium]MDH5309402.1 protein kinase [Gammaproteobacteria bacterium]
MNRLNKEQRDRLVTLAFVGILLVVMYGPGAPWFVGADRFLYDQLATRVNNPVLDDGLIVTLDPSKKDPGTLVDEFGRLLRIAKEYGARRIVLPAPPAIGDDAELPGWAAGLGDGVPVFVSSRHRLADVATRTGFLETDPDSDGILRSSRLWQLYDGAMSPSLPLAVALSDPEHANNLNMSSIDDAIYLSNYQPLARIDASDLLDGTFAESDIAGKTVFIDTEMPLVAAIAVLPSGQYVTRSEITASLLANLEQQEAITAPSWVNALQWLIPALLAIMAVLVMPGRSRSDILIMTAILAVVLVLAEALTLAIMKIRIDLGRPLFVVLGAGILTWWLTGQLKQVNAQAFKRGSAFLAAGRLEPAFAEFRRCEPSETLASAMYKLSLAFEEQSKPERAEAVLEWLKRTNGYPEGDPRSNDRPKGTPKRLGRYVIERKIGNGAMGAVYLARDPRINRPVALKVIPLEKEFEDEELEEARVRFFREAESAGRLTHPNIVTVYDAGEDKHLAYIAMEYLPGAPLTRFTDPKKLLAPRKALGLCARTAEALDYAHNQGVIHRDIKPANLLYNLRDDSLKISDFGVARLTDNNRTKTGIVLGTPMYMSPEQLNAEPLTGLSDLFSLGVTLYELLVGEAPFNASNIAVLMSKITGDDPAPVSNRRPGIPPSVDAVLLKALAKRPENRFSNGAEMAIALRNCARYAS